MRLPRRVSLLLTLSLLTPAATASAECAWVFWLEVSGPPTHEGSSRPLSGWGTREACEQALTQRLAADSEKDTSMDVTVDPQAGRPRLWVRRKGHPELLAVYTYVCLPDTVDPRGRRGSERSTLLCFREHRRCGDLDTSRTRAVACSHALHPLAAEDDARRRGVGNTFVISGTEGPPGAGFRDGVKFADRSAHALLPLVCTAVGAMLLTCMTGHCH
jgi:hypothetical protein